MSEKEKAYLVCDWSDEKARKIKGAPHVGVEFLGICRGRVVDEAGVMLNQHISSTIGWLRQDLVAGLDSREQYEIVDLLDEDVPERFRLSDE